MKTMKITIIKKTSKVICGEAHNREHSLHRQFLLFDCIMVSYHHTNLFSILYMQFVINLLYLGPMILLQSCFFSLTSDRILTGNKSSHFCAQNKQGATFTQLM